MSAARWSAPRQYPVPRETPWLTRDGERPERALPIRYLLMLLWVQLESELSICLVDFCMGCYESSDPPSKGPALRAIARPRLTWLVRGRLQNDAMQMAQQESAWLALALLCTGTQAAQPE